MTDAVSVTSLQSRIQDLERELEAERELRMTFERACLSDRYELWDTDSAWVIPARAAE